ncbi:BREX-1 system adenine-specific DNA-methyltransferase PglX [Planktothrix agardhii 1033]|nr:BREX-1 system adenine-specific DNA-methyltransferase PglX [Planktothrix agardhii 1033]
MSIARHHAEWLSLIEASGPFLSLQTLLEVFPQGLDAHDPERFRVLRQAYEEWLENHSDVGIHRTWGEWVLKEILEFPDEVLKTGQEIPQGLKVFIPEHQETLRPDYIVNSIDDSADSNRPKIRLLVQIYPPEQALEKTLKNSRWSASPATRMMELLRGTGVWLGLITNGEHWMLINAPTGTNEIAPGIKYNTPSPTVSYISWYANLWLEEKITLQAFRSLLGVQRFFGVSDDQTLEALFVKSADSQQEVTDQLGYQVRKAVEVLIQKIDKIDQDRNRKLLKNISQTQLYEAALFMMMRLVFLFSAEEKGLLRLGESLYDQSYSVSTLRSQLREIADHYGEEILERRHDAWCRLLATFRAVYGGIDHDLLRLPALGGDLFNPDKFPFLEGRTEGNWQQVSAQPIPIDNRTVLHLLEALQILQIKVPGGGTEPRRLSFRALDVEQIGHVYEGLLDHTAIRATSPVLGLLGTKDKEPEITLDELEIAFAKGENEFIKILKTLTGRSETTLKKAVDSANFNKTVILSERNKNDAQNDNNNVILSETKDLSGVVNNSRDSSQAQNDKNNAQNDRRGYAQNDKNNLQNDRRGYAQNNNLLIACNNNSELLERVKPFVNLIRSDTFGYPVIIPTGSVYVAQGNNRRETGTHYTPKSLTEEIVRYTLEPLVYQGVAEGKPKTEWKLIPTPELLNLKICDMAMGSGAFLVQVCRYLGERLIEAWKEAETANPGKIVIAPDGQLSKSRPQESIIPIDATERLMVAKRIIAERCIYGVDKNPLAVEMAKLSLWLETLQKDKPFTFLDHALKAGDSLVGVNLEQLKRWNLQTEGESYQLGIGGDDLQQLLDEVIDFRLQIESKPVNSPQDQKEKEYLLLQANARIKDLKDRADLLISSYLTNVKKQEQQDLRLTLLMVAQGKASITNYQREILPDLNSLNPFHWELEFPEVFLTARNEPESNLNRKSKIVTRQSTIGFNALVGNPPFMGGQKITGPLGTPYRDYLVQYLANNVRGSADLCAYFFLRGQQLISEKGGFGLVATNTIAQGDTREVGLDQMVQNLQTSAVIPHAPTVIPHAPTVIPQTPTVIPQTPTVILSETKDLSGVVKDNRDSSQAQNDRNNAQNDKRGYPQNDKNDAQNDRKGVIYRAVNSRKWEGTANLEVAFVWMRQGEWQGDFILDEKPVNGITPFLTVPGKLAGNPYRLIANQNKSFQGSIVLGMGFVLEPEEAQKLIEKNPKNKDVLFPYLNGEDLNSSSDQSPSRWVINFKNWPLDADHDDPKKPKGKPYAVDYPDCLKIIEEKVKPERKKLPPNNSFNKNASLKWWQFAGYRLSLTEVIASLERVLVLSIVTQYFSPAFCPNTWVYAHRCCIFSIQTWLDYAICSELQT